MSARTICTTAALGAAALATALAVTAPSPADAAGHHPHGGRVHDWAPAAKATLHPGTMMYTKGAQCTANFVYTDAVGHVFVGYAAHCAGLGESTDTDGCSTKSLPLGTKVAFREGGSVADDGTLLATGRLAYSSWRTMQKLGTKAENTCAYNDLALVRVRAKDVDLVNPSVPVWGGPTGIDTDGTAAGDQVFTYGNSSLRGGATVLSPHTGVSLGDQPADGGWSHPLYTASPGVPGDSGSGFLSADGTAIGVLSTLGLAPLPASNNIGDLAKELAFAKKHSGIKGLRLTKGTKAFSSTPSGVS
ncbi:hypothetical protein ABLE68_14225 [Nocardioides sp. CN2-186]|uniref:hypothetical protein n=1 Tax=Nocardioides tweenelious TaxID=3156607 RepID=UPI0032B4899F